VVFDKRINVFLNIGPNTAPNTFAFTRNAWFQRNGRKTPKLPAPEKAGIYHIDPELENAGTSKIRLTSPDA